MKRLNKILSGVMAGALATAPLAVPSCNSPQNVDNPPVEEDDDPSKNVPEVVYGPPLVDDFDPSENEPEEVYGPPEMFGIEDEDD